MLSLVASGYCDAFTQTSARKLSAMNEGIESPSAKQTRYPGPSLRRIRIGMSPFTASIHIC